MAYFNIFHTPLILGENTFHNYEEVISYLIRNTNMETDITEIIDTTIESNSEYQELLSRMPRTTHEKLRDYQENYDDTTDYSYLDEIINSYQTELAVGQILFHGGKLPCDNFVTTKPLSTTINPVIAIKEDIHFGKAYRRESIVINILKVMRPHVFVYLFNDENSSFNHEKELLLQSGLYLRKTDSSIITNEYELPGAYETKCIPVYLKCYEIN